MGRLCYWQMSRIGGLLNATFGNAVEMIVTVNAIKAGLVTVVQGSLLGQLSDGSWQFPEMSSLLILFRLAQREHGDVIQFPRAVACFR